MDPLLAELADIAARTGYDPLALRLAEAPALLDLPGLAAGQDPLIALLGSGTKQIEITVIAHHMAGETKFYAQVATNRGPDASEWDEGIRGTTESEVVYEGDDLEAACLAANEAYASRIEPDATAGIATEPGLEALIRAEMNFRFEADKCRVLAAAGLVRMRADLGL